jgi:hypothetical protein
LSAVRVVGEAVLEKGAHVYPRTAFNEGFTDVKFFPQKLDRFDGPERRIQQRKALLESSDGVSCLGMLFCCACDETSVYDGGFSEGADVTGKTKLVGLEGRALAADLIDGEIILATAARTGEVVAGQAFLSIGQRK